MFYCDGHKFETAEDALKYAKSRIYVTEAEIKAARQKIEEGKNVAFIYGFGQVNIYRVPQE